MARSESGCGGLSEALEELYSSEDQALSESPSSTAEKVATNRTIIAELQAALDVARGRDMVLVKEHNTNLIKLDDSRHFTFDTSTNQFPCLTPNFASDLKQKLGLDPEVVNKTLSLLGSISTEGCGEKIFASGFACRDHS